MQVRKWGDARHVSISNLHGLGLKGASVTTYLNSGCKYSNHDD